MRVSVWQQFSSNHSGGFSLVAQFKTPQEATDAASVIYNILGKIEEWYNSHPELYDQLAQEGLLFNPTPIEEELAKQYGLVEEWEYSIDWAEVEVNPKYSNQGLYTFDKLLFLADPIETWTWAQPFDTLLEKLGAKVVRHNADSLDPVPIVDMTCQAMDEVKAAAIVTNLSSSKTYSDGSVRPLIILPNGYSPYNGKISHIKAEIQCSDITMWSITGGVEHVAKFLPDLKTYLESQGCKNFVFSASGKLSSEID